MKKTKELEYLKKYKCDVKILKSEIEKLKTDDDLRSRFVKSFSELVVKSIKESISEDFHYLYHGYIDRAFDNFTNFFNILNEKSKNLNKREQTMLFGIGFEFLKIKHLDTLFVNQDEIIKEMIRYKENADDEFKSFIGSQEDNFFEQLISSFMYCFFNPMTQKYLPIPDITDISECEMNVNFKNGNFYWYYDEYGYDKYELSQTERVIKPGNHKIFSLGSVIEDNSFMSILFFKFLTYSYLFELEKRSDVKSELLETGLELLDWGLIENFIISNTDKIITDNLTCSETELKERIRTGDFPDYLNLYQNKES